MTDVHRIGASVTRAGETLVDRARRRRREAMATRAGCVVQTTLEGGNVIQFKFHEGASVSEVIDSLGPDDVIVSMSFGDGEGIGRA